MNQVIRSFDADSTRESLLECGRQLFASHGFKGTSVRAIAARAGVNLGAVTYHFGSKLDLYHAVIERVTAPIRERMSAPLPFTGSALDGIETFFRATFAFIAESPDVPRLILQQLVTEEPLPPAVHQTLNAYLTRISELIEAGQADGTIRAGEPRLLALSFIGSPMFLAIYRRALKEAVDFDQDDPDTRKKLTETVVQFVRAGLQDGSPS